MNNINGNNKLICLYSSYIYKFLNILHNRNSIKHLLFKIKWKKLKTKKKRGFVNIDSLWNLAVNVCSKHYADWKNLIPKMNKMRNLFEKLSITKLVFLIVMICLCIFTWYQFYLWQEIQNKLRENVVLMIVSFYFGQKVGEAQKDPLIDNEKKENE